MSYNIRPLILPLATVLTSVFVLVGLYFKEITPTSPGVLPVEKLVTTVAEVKEAVTPNNQNASNIAPLISSAGMFEKIPAVVLPPAQVGISSDYPQQPALIKKFVTMSYNQTSISPKLYRQVQKVFSGVISFNRRSSQDRITLLFEETFRNGKPQQIGNILLATVTHQHTTYQTVRYTDRHGHTGYYTLQGKALVQSEFLPAPVKYKRISDKFSLHRWHPILHIWRPHLGIDYAAPTGTPVRAVASGRVSFEGWGGGYGNVVMIHHDNKFQSLYAHLSKFNPLVKDGKWVQQGEIIGYVGATGLATGPHLHFGLYEYGVARNPDFFLPKFIPKGIPANEMNDFLVKTNQLLTHLASSQARNTIDG